MKRSQSKVSKFEISNYFLLGDLGDLGASAVISLYPLKGIL